MARARLLRRFGRAGTRLFCQLLQVHGACAHGMVAGTWNRTGCLTTRKQAILRGRRLPGRIPGAGAFQRSTGRDRQPHRPGAGEFFDRFFTDAARNLSDSVGFDADDDLRRATDQIFHRNRTR